MFLSRYQVGGSLQGSDPSYVIRAADLELYTALKQGKFCSIFEARQMGKSSLLVRIKQHLEAEGYCCVFLNMSSFSHNNVMPESWYKGLLFQISLELNLFEKMQFMTWWEQHKKLQPIQRIHQFIQDILTLYLPQHHLIFLIDELDSLLNLPFPLDDFFDLIRFYYEHRDIALEYNRLTFAVFGVATPTDFVKNSLKSPFLIGTTIKLSGFQATEVQPLIQGFEGKVSHPNQILKEILFWTDGQPFLTQKLCKIVWQMSQQKPEKFLHIPEGKEKFWVAKIVHYFVLNHWELCDEPEHLRTIQNRLLYHRSTKHRFLKIYQKVLQGLEVKVDESREQNELLLSGLLVQRDGQLQIKNLIYRHVFNHQWFKSQLTQDQGLEPQSLLKRSSFSSS